MAVDLLIGPAGAGKDAAAIEALDGDREVLVDLSRLSAALYPHLGKRPRTAAQLAMLRRVRAAAVAVARDLDLGGVVTLSTSDPGTLDRWQERAGGDVFVLDPGRQVVERRLRQSQGAELMPQCDAALDRWYSGAGAAGRRFRKWRGRR